MTIDATKPSTPMLSVWTFFLAAVIVLGTFNWFNDAITLNGVHTAELHRADFIV